MYRYDEFDADFVRARARQFRAQVARRLAGSLTEEEFKPLRLMNGVYLQLHAYMLRIAIPYGTLSSAQLRVLADIGETYDKGYGHFTTRQNIQFNWLALRDIPDILDTLSDVQMHCIQTSGNCIRNITADHWAGVAQDEIEDPRPICELLRHWSSLHPEFSYLPRKFKIAVSGAPHDRAAVKFHDIGLRLHKRNGKTGWEVLAGGGQGRTPMIAVTVRDFLPQDALLPYLEAIMRVYNLHGRRDNKYKARIKILVHSLGADEFRRQVEAAYEQTRQDISERVSAQELARIRSYFALPHYKENLPPFDPVVEKKRARDPDFARWMRHNSHTHKVSGYAIVTISLKSTGAIPGDASSEQMRVVAALAARYSADEIRVSHHQNLVLPHVRIADLPAIWQILRNHDLDAANIGLIGDIISCPGLDYCALATARSIPIAQSLSRRFSDADFQDDVGKIKINISGCINACGHHHVGHIGILGLEKKGEEFYQISLGGDSSHDAAIGTITGRGFAASEVGDAIERIIDYYRNHRLEDEPFSDMYRRVGDAPFKEALYGA